MEILVHSSYSDEKTEIIFIDKARKGGMEYIIEVRDGGGELEELWAISENEIIEAFKAFSKRQLYGQLYKIDDFIHAWYVPAVFL